MADSAEMWSTRLLAIRKGVLRSRLRVRRQIAMTSRWITIRRRENGARIELGVWSLVTLAGFLLWTPLQRFLTQAVGHDGAMALRSLVGTIGGAMIGATAIASSFILFALQVNVERLPHGLFRHFSSDRKLIASVALSLILAIGGTTLSLVSNDGHLATIVIVGVLLVAIILRLLFYAYQRSLLLIDPAAQLQLIHARVVRELRRLSRQVDSLTTLIDVEEVGTNPRVENSFDTRRAAVLQSNAGWARGVQNAAMQAAAYARRAGESGDQEVSAYALTTLVHLNRAYIDAKGRTFFASQLLLDDGLVTDGMFNSTLEDLRRLRSGAQARGDEIQLEQIFNTMDMLVREFCMIKYGKASHSKSHALLAARYLESAVEAVTASGLTDTVMRGVQAMGSSAACFIDASKSQEAVSLIKKVAMIGTLGAIKADSKPVTLVAMEQLRDITLRLLRTEEHDPGYALRQLNESVSFIAKAFLQTPDSAFGGHSTYLAPYYSVTTANGLSDTLANMANALLERPAGDEVGGRVIDHLEEWADQIFITQKELLLLAVEKRSPFFFDISHWIAQVSEVLLVAASAPAAREHSSLELRKHALWLVSTLSWIPADAEAAKFVENWSHRDNLVDLAVRCRDRDEVECYKAVDKMMFDWALKAGSHHTGWGTLGQWLLALVGLAVTSKDDEAGKWLKTRLQAKLSTDTVPNDELRERAASDLKDAAREIRRREFETDRVRLLISRGEPEPTRQLLLDLADILAPAVVVAEAD